MIQELPSTWGYFKLHSYFAGHPFYLKTVAGTGTGNTVSGAQTMELPIKQFHGLQYKLEHTTIYVLFTVGWLEQLT